MNIRKERRTMKRVKIGQYDRFSLEFPKLCLIVEVKVITLYDVVLDVCRVLVVILFHL